MENSMDIMSFEVNDVDSTELIQDEVASDTIPCRIDIGRTFRQKRRYSGGYEIWSNSRDDHIRDE